MMITSLNLNGLHNALERGLLSWVREQNADVFCLQDLRLSERDFPVADFEKMGLNVFIFDAENPRLGGTAILSKTMPKAVIRGLGSSEFDLQGRFIQADFDDVSIASILFPSAPDDDSLKQRQGLQKSFLHHCKKASAKRRDYIYCASLMMAHQSLDIGRWQTRLHEPGCRPEERNFMDLLLGPAGFSDAFRLINNQDGQYSYWPLDETRELGARFDYQLVSPKLRTKVLTGQIAGEVQLSPHRPLSLSYDLSKDFF